MREKVPLAMSSILGQYFHGPQKSKKLWPYLHVKQNMWGLHP